MPATSGQIRVATFNVYSPQNPDWERRFALMSRALPGVAADIVAPQEVPVDDGFATVEALLGDACTVHPFSRSSDDGVGGVLATRVPSRLVEEIDQRGPEREGSLPWAATLLTD